MSSMKSLKRSRDFESKKNEQKRQRIENTKKAPTVKSSGRPPTKANNRSIFTLDLICKNIKNTKVISTCTNDTFTKVNKIKNGIKCTRCGTITPINWHTLQSHHKPENSLTSGDEEYDIIYGHFVNKKLTKNNKEYLITKIGKTTLTDTQFDRLKEEKSCWKNGADIDISVPFFNEVFDFAKNDTMAGLEKYENLLFLFKLDPSQERIIRCQLSDPIHEDQISRFFTDLNCFRKIGKTEYVYLEPEKAKKIQNAFISGNLKLKDFPVICENEIIGFSKQVIMSKDNLEECLLI